MSTLYIKPNVSRETVQGTTYEQTYKEIQSIYENR